MIRCIGAWRRGIGYAAALLLLAMLLQACGNKGPLYYPRGTTPSTTGEIDRPDVENPDVDQPGL